MRDFTLQFGLVFFFLLSMISGRVHFRDQSIQTPLEHEHDSVDLT